MTSPVIVIARLTFREAVRRKIVLTALVLGACFLLIYAIGFNMVTNTMNPNFKNLNSLVIKEGYSTLFLAGLYAVNFLCIAMAALLAADTLAGEINSGTVQSVVTKPIRRIDVVLGKWLGFAGLLGIYLFGMSGGVALSVGALSRYTPPNLLAGIALIYLESLLVMSVSLMCSSMLSSLATGGVVFGLYGLSFIGGWVEQIGSFLKNQTAVNVGIITSLIIPSEALWRRAAYEMQSPLSGALGMSPFGTISVPSTLMVLYSVIYLLTALGIALRVFTKRDL